VAIHPTVKTAGFLAKRSVKSADTSTTQRRATK